jgi:hypothetical protein
MGLKNFFKTYFGTSPKYQKEPVKSETTYQNVVDEENDNLLSFAVYRKYQKIISRHFELTESIKIKYSIAINQPTIFNKHAEECEELCLEDIQIAPIYKQYLDEASSEEKTFYGMYPSFSILAKLYEKENKLDKAMVICASAIKLGFLIDQSDGGMQGRLARLIKKYNKNNNKNLQFDYEKNILFDDKTGDALF